MNTASSRRSSSDVTGEPRKTILVTGASRGFGYLAATRLVSDGWHVIGSVRTPAAGQALRQQIEKNGGDPAALDVICVDVRDTDALHASIAGAIERRGGNLDAALCNAGVAIGGAFEDVPAADFRTVIDINVIGLVETTRAVLPALRRNGGGRLLLLSSDSGLYGTPALTAYTAAKYAVEGFGEALSYEVGPLGVSVSLIEPGAFATDIWSATVHVDENGPYARFTEIMRATIDKIASNAPAPDPVITTIVRALTADRPKLRYPVGTDARVMSAAKGVITDRQRTRLMRSQTGLSKWAPTR